PADPDLIEELIYILLSSWQSVDTPLILNFSGYPRGEEVAERLGKVMQGITCANLTISFRDCDIGFLGTSAICDALVAGNYHSSKVTLHIDSSRDKDNQVFIDEKIENLIKSEQCPLDLTLSFDPGWGVLEAMKYNITATLILKQGIDEDLVKSINLINKRNQLLKKYPQLINEILSFCKSKNLFYTDSEHLIGILDEISFESCEHFPDDLQQFFCELTSHYREGLITVLNGDEIHHLIDRVTHALNCDTKEAFLKLPLERLLEHDLIIYLYQNDKTDHRFRSQIKALMLENSQLIKKSQSLSLLALLASMGIEPDEREDLDHISLYLLAYHFSDEGTKAKWYKILDNLDTHRFPINELHLILAAKINNTIYSLLSGRFYKDNPLNAPKTMEQIKLIQNTVRIKNRTQSTYPMLFSLPEDSPNNCYSFWHNKPKSKLLALEKNIRHLALNYAKEREIKLPNGQALSFIGMNTFQYVSSQPGLMNMLQGFYFLSQDARHRLDMVNYTSHNIYEDQLIGDHQLVCTAPLSVLPNIERSAFAKISINLTKIPTLYLQNCIIKMADYPSRNCALYEIALTHSIHLQLLPYEVNECTLLKMSSDPRHIGFAELPLEADTSAFILYNEELFYADRRNRRLTPILIPSHSEGFAKLKEKFGDAPTRLNKEDLALFASLTGIRQTDRSKSSYRFYNIHDEKISYTLTLSGTHELFHGIEGFKEALCHFLFIVNALPNEGEGKIIKDELIDYLYKFDNENLIGYLDWVFSQLFKYMEIDFPYGLPMSLDYVNSVHFAASSGVPAIDFQRLSSLAEHGVLGDYESQLLEVPAIMYQVLKAVRPEFLPKMASELEGLHPASYLFAINKLPELLHKNNAELKEYANQLAATSSKHASHYNLFELISAFKKELANNPKLCQQLIEQHRETIGLLKEKVRNLYNNFTFAGGESKLRELITNPEIMNLLTGKNKGVIAAIIALEIQSELNKELCPDTVVQTVVSQRTKQNITITLSSILFHTLKQPGFFLEAYPVNSQFDFIANELLADYVKRSTKSSFMEYIKQKMLFKQNYSRLEKGIIELCKSTTNICLADYTLKENSYEYNPLHWKHYASEIKDISYLWQDFCQNPSIVDEINHGLPYLIRFTFGNKDKPTLKQLVSGLLNSSALLNPYLAHILFDSTHFPVALKGVGVNKIQLADRQFSRVVLCKKEPNFNDLQEDVLMALLEDEQLTIYWRGNGNVVNRCFREEHVGSLVDRLSSIEQESTDLQLIQEITAQYGCAHHELSFHELIIACMEHIATTGVNLSNAVMAEQLSLRLKKLQYDFGICIQYDDNQAEAYEVSAVP
ncbi:TPA: hypothetical protein ACU9KK_003804, partial [Legionella anisa]